MEYCVPVLLLPEVNTVALLFWETDGYEDGDGNTGLDLDEEVTVNSDLDVDTVVTFDDGGTFVKRLGVLSDWNEQVIMFS